MNMKNRSGLFLLLGLVGLLTACQSANSYTTKTVTDSNGYTYTTVEGDPSQTRIYTLENGLKVYLSVNKNEPRLQAYLPVKAGGKFDPATSTGLAHYLEHMMFKGTHKFGTQNWEEEKVYIDSIETLYEQYREITDPEARKAHYKRIDEVSNVAATYTIPNEYDKLMSLMGGSGTNAYTTEDRTVYTENIPANQVENFLDVQSERFSTIVNRLFHTELEAVYEEKNRGLDNDFWKVFETTYERAFPAHPYGTQTVIGTIEHLKNPSISDINAYFDKYYRPNNMAVCLAGDIDPDQTIQWVDQYFSALEPNDLQTYQKIESPMPTAATLDTIYGPNPDFLFLSYRIPGFGEQDYIKAQMVDMILNNSLAGLIDLNLVQQQKVLSAQSFIQEMNDYSIHAFYAMPRDGQNLKELQDLVMQQIEMVKQGEFEDWLPQAIVNDLKKSKLQALESNAARADDMVMAFTNEMDWQDLLSRYEQMERLSKADIMAFAQQYYGDVHFTVHKLNGQNENKAKVEKPEITSVQVNRDVNSDLKR